MPTSCGSDRVPELLERCGAVHLGSLVHFGGDRLHGRQDEEEGERKVAPGLERDHGGKRDREPEGEAEDGHIHLARAEEVYRRADQPHLDQHGVDRAGKRVEQDKPGEGHRDHRCDIGEEEETAKYASAFERRVHQLGGEEANNQRACGGKHCVVDRDTQHEPELGAVKNALKVLQREIKAGEDVDAGAGDSRLGLANVNRVIEKRLGDLGLQAEALAEAAFQIT
jgi:hypothetical protein